MTVEFKSWEKIPRFNRNITVTEKIDGTNAAINICLVEFDEQPADDMATYWTFDDGTTFEISAQSRTRLITPLNDNAGFGRWVWENTETLIKDLGVGRHFGEWWGQGIQRKYGMDRKVFSLFNTFKWELAEFVTPNMTVVPVLYDGPMRQDEIEDVLYELRETGSVAATEFSKWNQPAEGVCVYHSAANSYFKITLENDEKPKGQR